MPRTNPSSSLGLHLCNLRNLRIGFDSTAYEKWQARIQPWKCNTGQNRFAVASGCQQSALKFCPNFASSLGRGICLLLQAVLHCARDSLIFRSAGANEILRSKSGGKPAFPTLRHFLLE